MTVAKNLEVTHRIDTVVRDVGDNVKVIEGVAQSVDYNVKATKHST
jgi:hypothetical protein